MSLTIPLSESNFKTGGALEPDSLYVQRPADEELFAALQEGEFCYVLAPRQIGKSSLRARVSRRLEAEGVRCVSVELTVGKSTEEQWYYGLVRRIWSNLALQGDERTFWTSQKLLAPTERFLLFLSEVVLTQIEQPIVIFIDEIETTLELPFRRDDFFATIRSLYNMRADQTAFRRMAFCLLGVITPSDLIENPARTPFNIGRGIRLEDFARPQMDALRPGLQGLGASPESLLDAIYDWTGGHPYMTLNLCDAVARQGTSDVPAQERVAPLIKRLFLERGRSEDSNLAATDEFFSQKPRPAKIAGGVMETARKDGAGQETAGDATATAEPESLPWYMRHRAAMLQLYRRLLEGKPEPAQGGNPVQMALRLTGIAAERGTGENRNLQVRNRIFAAVFDAAWLKEQESGRLIADALADWNNANRAADYLLHGERLMEAQKWADGQTELTRAERQFLEASVEAERGKAMQQAEAARKQEEARREKAETAQQRAEEKAKTVVWFRLLAGVLAVAAIVALIAMNKAILNGREAQANEVIAKANEAKATANAKKAQASELEANRQANLAAEKAHIAKSNAEKADKSAAEAIKATKKEKEATKQAQKDRQLAINAQKNAQQREKEARSGVFAAQSLLQPDSEKSVQLALAAVEAVRPPTPLATKALREALSYGRSVRGPGLAADLLVNLLSSGSEPVAFAPTGKQIVTISGNPGSGDITARIWSVDTGQVIRTLPNDGSKVLSVAFSPDSKRIVTVSEKSAAKIWNADTGKEIRTLEGLPLPSGGPRSITSAVAFSLNGKRVMIGFDAGRGLLSPIASSGVLAKIWSADTGQVIQTFNDVGGAISISPDGKRLVTNYHGTAKILNVDTGEVIRTFNGSTLHSAAFSPEGKRIVTVFADSTAKIWNADTGEEIQTLKRGDHGFAAGNIVAFSPDGKFIVTGGSATKIWDAKTGKELRTLKGHMSIYRVAFTQAGKQLMTLGIGGSIRIYDQSVWKGSPVMLEKAALRQVHDKKLSPKELDMIVQTGVQDLPAPAPPREQPRNSAPTADSPKSAANPAQRSVEKSYKK